MSKLKLEQIALYLPYDLQWLCLDKESEEYELHYMTGIFSYSGEMQVQVGSYDISLEDDLEDDVELYKPVLRPLNEVEDFIRNLWDKGDKTVQEYCSYEFLECHDLLVEELYNERVENLPYGVLKILLENHFDVFDLIFEGLAIDINEIN